MSIDGLLPHAFINLWDANGIITIIADMLYHIADVNPIIVAVNILDSILMLYIALLIFALAIWVMHVTTPGPDKVFLAEVIACAVNNDIGLEKSDAIGGRSHPHWDDISDSSFVA